MTETDIDIKQQLSPGQVRGYTEKMLANGALEYNNGSIIMLSKDPLDQCVKRGIIETYHRDAGRQMQIIYEMSVSKTSGRHYNGIGAEAGEVDAASHNKEIRRQLSKSDWKRICIITFPKKDMDGRNVFNEADYSVLFAFAPDLQRSFDALEKAIHESREIIMERIRVALNNA